MPFLDVRGRSRQNRRMTVKNDDRALTVLLAIGTIAAVASAIGILIGFGVAMAGLFIA